MLPLRKNKINFGKFSRRVQYFTHTFSREKINFGNFADAVKGHIFFFLVAQNGAYFHIIRKSFSHFRKSILQYCRVRKAIQPSEQ